MNSKFIHFLNNRFPHKKLFGGDTQYFPIRKHGQRHKTAQLKAFNKHPSRFFT